MRWRTLSILVVLLVATGCSGSGGSQDTAPLDADAFTGEAQAIEGGTVDLSTFADQDLVVWFWSPW